MQPKAAILAKINNISLWTCFALTSLFCFCVFLMRKRESDESYEYTSISFEIYNKSSFVFLLALASMIFLKKTSFMDHTLCVNVGSILAGCLILRELIEIYLEKFKISNKPILVFYRKYLANCNNIKSYLCTTAAFFSIYAIYNPQNALMYITVLTYLFDRLAFMYINLKRTQKIMQ